MVAMLTVIVAVTVAMTMVLFASAVWIPRATDIVHYEINESNVHFRAEQNDCTDCFADVPKYMPYAVGANQSSCCHKQIKPRAEGKLCPQTVHQAACGPQIVEHGLDVDHNQSINTLEFRMFIVQMLTN